MMRWATLALVTLAFALSAVAALAVAPLAPFLRDALGLTRFQVGLLLPALYFGGVAMSLPAGWLTDRVGVRLTLALGQALTGTMIVGAALGASLGWLLAGLLLAGVGFSVLNPATGRAVVEWFPPRGRGVAMGIKQTGLTLGGILGALALPPLALALDWRRALAAAGAACLVSAVLVALAYRSPTTREAPEATARARLGDLSSILLRPGVLVVLTCGLAMSMAQYSMVAYLALYANEVLALGAVAAGQLLAIAQAGGTVSRLLWGAASDRFFGGRRRPGVVACAVVAIVANAAFALGDAVPRALLGTLALAAGVGTFGWVGLYFALIAEIGGPRYAGLLTGVAVMFAWSGVLLGPPVFGAVLDATGAYVVPWLLLATLALLVAVALPRLRPLVQRE